jgi:hypothetical protein
MFRNSKIPEASLHHLRNMQPVLGYDDQSSPSTRRIQFFLGMGFQGWLHWITPYKRYTAWASDVVSYPVYQGNEGYRSQGDMPRSIFDAVAKHLGPNERPSRGLSQGLRNTAPRSSFALTFAVRTHARGRHGVEGCEGVDEVHGRGPNRAPE